MFLLILFIILWAKLGVNVSNFPLSLSAIGFHFGFQHRCCLRQSVEKISAIKAKRLAIQRTTIKRNEDAMGTDLRVILDFDVDSTKDIISRERQ